jgi:hypothetical protein
MRWDESEMKTKGLDKIIQGESTKDKNKTSIDNEERPTM